jgi:hypothetical protein
MVSIAYHGIVGAVPKRRKKSYFRVKIAFLLILKLSQMG